MVILEFISVVGYRTTFGTIFAVQEIGWNYNTIMQEMYQSKPNFQTNLNYCKENM